LPRGGGELKVILSKANKIIFIKGVKVGGTSIEIALSAFCGPNDIITPITPIDERKRVAFNGGARNYSNDPEAERAYLNILQETALSDLATIRIPDTVYYSHMPLRDILRLQNQDLSGYRLVCVERNPYAKILSWANHKLSFDAYRVGGELRADWQDILRYLSKTVADGSIAAVKNIERYRGADGTIAARVMRFETLSEDFRQFSADTGLAFSGDLPHEKKGILADDIEPRDVFSRAQIAAINDMFCDEFETFGYRRLPI
jgi:hypothetical protein